MGSVPRGGGPSRHKIRTLAFRSDGPRTRGSWDQFLEVLAWSTQVFRRQYTEENQVSHIQDSVDNLANRASKENF